MEMIAEMNVQWKNQLGNLIYHQRDITRESLPRLIDCLKDPKIALHVQIGSRFRCQWMLDAFKHRIRMYSLAQSLI